MKLNESHITEFLQKTDYKRQLPELIRKLLSETSDCMINFGEPFTGVCKLPAENDLGELTASISDWISLNQSYWAIDCGLNGDNIIFDTLNCDNSGESNEFSQLNLVLVSPKVIQKREEIQNKYKEHGNWKKVFVLDAKYISKWLQISFVTKCWFEEKIGLNSKDIVTAEKWWEYWSNHTDPKITMQFVNSIYSRCTKEFLDMISDNFSEISIFGKSKIEIIAFVISSFNEITGQNIFDKTVIIKNPKVKIPENRKLIVIQSFSNFDEVEQISRNDLLVINVNPSIKYVTPHRITLSVSPIEFKNDLALLEKYDPESEHLTHKSNCSITVLRRIISNESELLPKWVKDDSVLRMLIPFSLCGAWVNDSRYLDLKTITKISNGKGDEIHQNLKCLLELEESPIIQHGEVFRVESQFESLKLIGNIIERTHFDQFLDCVEEFLSERDPVLELPIEEWWTEDFYGPMGSYSEFISEGICEALNILANHEDVIVRDELKINIQGKIDGIVQKLFYNLNSDRWLSIRKYLPHLAEAAPENFLIGIENDLQRTVPAIKVLLGSTGGVTGGDNLRTELLWALEKLAWHEEYFERVCGILFQLQKFEIEDNWSNTAHKSTDDLFRLEMPSTLLPISDRVEVLRNNLNTNRTAVLDICTSFFPSKVARWGSKTSFPKWRFLHKNENQPTRMDYYDNLERIQDLLIELGHYTTEDLEKLIEIWFEFDEVHILALMRKVKLWADNAVDSEKQRINNIFRLTLDYFWNSKKSKNELYLKVFQNLKTSLSVHSLKVRFKWLFDDRIVNPKFLIESNEDRNTAFNKNFNLLEQRRSEAIKQIDDSQGRAGIIDLIKIVNYPETVVRCLQEKYDILTNPKDWIIDILKIENETQSIAFIREVFRNLDSKMLLNLMESFKEGGFLDNSIYRSILFKSLPLSKQGWTIVEEFSNDINNEIKADYWKSIQIYGLDQLSGAELEFVAGRLIMFDRAINAYSYFSHNIRKISTTLWVKILTKIPKLPNFDLRIDSEVFYNLDDVFTFLDGDQNISDEQIARLEFPFIRAEVWRIKRRRILAFHRLLAKNPKYVVELLTWGHDRGNENENRNSNGISKQEQIIRSEIAIILLNEWSIIPGLNENNTLDEVYFNKWIFRAFRLASDVDCSEFLEQHLGILFAKFAIKGNLEIFHSAEIIKIMDDPGYDKLRESFLHETYFKSGVTFRNGSGVGKQDNRFAKNCEKLALKFEAIYPRFSRIFQKLAKFYKFNSNIKADHLLLSD